MAIDTLLGRPGGWGGSRRSSFDKDKSRRPRLLALAFAVSLSLLAGPTIVIAGPLPVNGNFVGGAGSISTAGSTMTINQTSSRGVIDWRQFSIGKGNRVSFLNGNGATLNRVTGGDPSSILGSLSATGSLYLINPQGILVGPSGVVTTGGRFVASTLDTCNCAFMNASLPTFKGDSNASVVNMGKIGSTGGDVYLISRASIVNAGEIRAPRGVAGLAAGAMVLLGDASSAEPVYVQTGSGGSVTNLGGIGAAQVSLQAADGNIFAFAGNHASIRATGTATRDGHVWLMADRGSVTLLGPIEARNADGSGGTVDVDTRTLSLGSEMGGAPAVKAKQWNITTPAFTLDGATGGALARSLDAGTSIGITTTAAQGASGDIDIIASFGWNSAASLTLNAYRSLTLAAGQQIANYGAGNLTLRADANALDNGGSVTNLGTIDWSQSLGAVAAFYDMNGAYTAGAQLRNAAWTPAPMSGVRDQLTGYALVNSYTDLQRVANNLSGNYALGKDIDASASSDREYVPLGNVDTPFTGQFDGFGHKIDNLDLVRTVDADHGEQGYVMQALGLFGIIGPSGLARNLALNANSGGFGEGAYGKYGLLAGINEGTIVRVDTSGSLSYVGGASFQGTYGGLVGRNTGSISRSSSSAYIDTEGDNGGLVGDNAAGATIEQSYATGAVNSEAHSGGGGGLVGTNEGTVTQSYATGDVAFSPDYCGPNAGQQCVPGAAGLVGTNSGTITQSFATGKVTEPNPPDNPDLLPAVGITTTNTGTIGNDVYWNKETTGASIGVYSGTQVPAANGLTTAQMSDAAFFVGYDFGPDGVWAMPAGATHPVLSWQLGR